MGMPNFQAIDFQIIKKTNLTYLKNILFDYGRYVFTFEQFALLRRLFFISLVFRDRAIIGSSLAWLIKPLTYDLF